MFGWVEAGFTNLDAAVGIRKAQGAEAAGDAMDHHFTHDQRALHDVGDVSGVIVICHRRASLSANLPSRI